MKSILPILLCVFSLLSVNRAQSSSNSALLLAAKTLPKCALTCMTGNVAKSPCKISDFPCIFHNETLVTQIEICIAGSCTIRESLTTKNFTQTLLGVKPRNHSSRLLVIALVGGGFAILAFILRVIARLPFLGGTWGWDDWIMVLAMLTAVPFTFLAIPTSRLGLGRDIWTVPFDNITEILHVYYFDEILYTASLGLTKTSMLLFYLRLFPAKEFRRIVYAAVAVCVAYLISFLTATSLQCFPIRVTWEMWDGEHKGRCFNFNLEVWVNAAVNILLDLVVICLPLKPLSQLAMGREKKFRVMTMFLGGFFVTIVSILRLQWLVKLAKSQNVTWDYTPIGYWSTLECHVGIIFACLPAIRALQMRLFPDSKVAKSGYLYYGSNSRSNRSDRVRTPNPLSNITHDDDNNLIPLENYESRAGTAISNANTTSESINGNSNGNGDEVVLLPSPQKPEVSLQYPAKVKSEKGPRKGKHGPRISVTKEYSVIVDEESNKGDSEGARNPNSGKT